MKIKGFEVKIGETSTIPYMQALALTDIHLFSNRKKYLSGKPSESNEKVIATVD